MNTSQHLFMPLAQKLAELGYYGAGGSLVTNGVTSQNYRSYPLMRLPQSPTVNIFQTFNDYSGTKLRTWSSDPASSQSTTAYNVLYGAIVPLTDELVVYSSADYRDDYFVRLIYWNEPLSSDLLFNITKIPQTEEEER